MTATFAIGGFEVGAPDSLLIIAEAGVNHDGDPAAAHALIDAAADAGADIVKFQTFDPAELVSEAAPTAPYQSEDVGTQADLLESLVLPDSLWAELQAHAAERAVGFLSTPFDLGSARMLIGLGVPALKVGSGELTNLSLLRDLADLGVPLLLSTGMATVDEVADAVRATAAAPGLGLLHCVSAYPAPAEQANLRVLPRLVSEFGVPVGWSDHTVGPATAVAAVALGASVLEKHLTLDRARPGPDHAASADPEQFAEYVTLTRTAHAALGDGDKRRMPAEFENAPVVRRSWHARHRMEAGAVLTGDDLVALRPEVGLSANITIEGRRLLQAVDAGTPITAELLNAQSEVAP